MQKRYRLYIDESGDHTYGKNNIIRSNNGIICENYYPELEDVSRRYLLICGVLIEQEYYKYFFQPELESIKKSNFNYDPDEPLILHREDIIGKRGKYWILRYHEREKKFNEDILNFIKKHDYRIISVLIDKKSHIERYRESAYHPYHYCLTAILERYCGFLNYINAVGDVMAESRGKNEDNELKNEYINIYNRGTQFRKPGFFRNVLTSKEIKIKQKKSNIAGLQISDIIANPIRKQILFEKGIIDEFKGFSKDICDAIVGKFNKHMYSGKIDGYGKIFLK